MAGFFSACAVALPLLTGDGWTDVGRGITGVLFLGVAGIAITALGIYDDLRGARARTKLAVQIPAALLLYAGGFRLDRIDLLLGSPLALGSLSLPLTVLWIVGISNAFNLIDGLDGLATGIALTASAAVFAIATGSGDALVMLLALALIGSLLGFFVYNVNPASVFMGDTGSLFLGATLAALPLRHVDGAAVPFGAILIVLGIPIVDTFGAIARRALRGTPAFSADREHLHHRLLGAGLSQRQAVLVLWIAGALLATAGALAAGGIVSGSAALVGSVALAVIGVAALAMPEGWSPILVLRRKRNRERLATIRKAAQLLRGAPSIPAINELLATLAPRLDAQVVQLRESLQLRPANGVEHTDDSRARTSLCLNPGRPYSGTLEVVWAGSRRQERDAEIALELLGTHVAASLRRIREQPTVLPWPGALGKEGPTEEPTTRILGYETTAAGRDECVQSVVRWIEQGVGCRWLACINHHAYVVAKGDRGFAEALRSADWLIPDGVGFVLASRLGPQGIRERITGRDIFLGVNEALERRGGGTVFFLGSTDETLALIRARMQRDFPSVRVVGFHAPLFKTRLSEAEVEDAIGRINEARPDVLWVAMNAPQQERWIHGNKERLGVKFAAAVGDVLDSYGRRQLPVVRQGLGLEWLPKPMRDRRAWRATFVSAPRFLWDVLTAAEEPLPLPLTLTPPPVERLEQRASSMTSAAVGTASASDSQEAHP